ncbi:MAG: hypothetical protein M5U25_12050 [Planctomycetota bacterium]|nr:hypothetical protein [Planctomycetota bacterium]
MKQIIVIAALAALSLATVDTHAQRKKAQPVKADKLETPWTLEEVKQTWQPGLQLNIRKNKDTEPETHMRRTVVESDDTGPKVMTEVVAEGGCLKYRQHFTEHWPEDGLLDMMFTREMVKKPVKKKRNFEFGSRQCWIYSLSNSKNGIKAEVECWYLADKEYAGIMAYAKYLHTAPNKNVEITYEVTGIRLATELPKHPAEADALQSARAKGAQWTYQQSTDGKHTKQARYTAVSQDDEYFSCNVAERADKRAEWGQEAQWNDTVSGHGFAMLPGRMQLRDVDKVKTEKVKLEIGNIECVILEYRRTDSRNSWMGKLYYPTDPKYGGMPARWVEWEMDPQTGKSKCETRGDLIEFKPAG